MQQPENEWGDKPSDRRQWHERSRAPIFKRNISTAEIEEFRRSLVASYKCNDSDIFHKFERIDWEDDEDRFDYLLLNFIMNCVIFSIPQQRIIFSFKVPIPDRVKVQTRQTMGGAGPAALTY